MCCILSKSHALQWMGGKPLNGKSSAWRGVLWGLGSERCLKIWSLFRLSVSAMNDTWVGRAGKRYIEPTRGVCFWLSDLLCHSCHIVQLFP